MDSLMNIRIRVLAARAQSDLARTQGRLRMLKMEAAAANRATSMVGAGGISNLNKWGSRLQWTGRQLGYNFTLPLALAGGAATKFALDNERAMVRVEKVYGDGSAAFNRLAKTEIPALQEAFKELSNVFGVAQADVINIAGDWAAAGASGVALARSVKLTLETMVLGEMNAAEATEALIAIQAQYGMSTEKLTKTIDVLNMTENQTGVSMQGLIVGFQKAAGEARGAGIDIEHLAAMMAALVPATGSPSTAGNALKTIFSRLLVPTKEATEVLSLMGIETEAMGWKSLNAAQRLELMSKSFMGLDDSQRAVVSSVIASRWQVNKFGVLMRDMANTNGYYRKSLEATSDTTRNFKQRTYELRKVLESNPQRLKQMWVILQNAMADVIQPMIPYIVWAASAIARMARSFSEMNPVLQKSVLFGLAFLALLGPIARYVGSVALLGFVLGKAFGFMGRGAASAGRMLAAPFLVPLRIAGGAIAWMIGGAAAFAMRVPALIMTGIARSAAALALAKSWLVIWRGIWASMAAVVGIHMVLVKTIMAANFVQIRAMWLINGAFGAGVWSRMWTAIKMITIGGAAATASATAGLAIIPAFFARIGAKMRLVWGTTYAALVAIAAGARTALWTVSAMFALGNIGIFTRMYRTLVIVSSAGWAGLIAIYKLGVRGMLLATVGGFKTAAAFLIKWGKWFVSWPALIFMAVLGVVYAFRDQIAAAWKQVVGVFSNTGPLAGAGGAIVDMFNRVVEGITRAFWMLPNSVTGALIAVIKVVRQAALQVYEWLSYLNPFQRHSPSLVESVTAGMAVVEKQYARVSKVGGIFQRVGRDLAAAKKIMNGMGAGPFQEERKDVAKSHRKAIPVFDRLAASWRVLTRVAATQEAAVSRQEAVVNSWKGRLDSANAALDKQQAILDSLQGRLDGLTATYEESQAAIDAFVDAPLKGMRAVEDQIFANDMAQKKLRLEMMKWEQVNGSFEDSRDTLAALRGDMELLQGMANGLRANGAGSDITGPIEAQVRALEEKGKALEGAMATSPVQKMESELERLGRAAEVLDLEQSLRFDPLRRQIEQLADTSKEITFDEATAGIRREQAAQNAIRPTMEALTRSVKAQEAAVRDSTTARDAIQVVYDREDAKLQRLQDAYSRTEDAIRNVESALQDMGGAAAQANNKANKAGGIKLKKGAKALKGDGFNSPGAMNFKAAKGGNFPEVGGFDAIGREGGMGDQSDMIKKLTEGLTGDLAKSFGSINIMDPIKKKFNAAWAWVKTNIGPSVSAVGSSIGTAFSSIPNPFGKVGWGKGFKSIFNNVSVIVKDAWSGIKAVIDLFAPDILRIWDQIVSAGRDIWNELGPELAKFKDIWPNIGRAIGGIWKVIKPVVAIIGGALLGVIKVLASILGHTLGPAFDLIIDVVRNVIRIIRGVVQVIVGLLSGDLKMVADGIGNIFMGLLKGIGSILKNGFLIVWGIVKGFVGGIIGFFKWLYDVLIGHSIVPDMINGIIRVFKWLGRVIKWVWNNFVMPIVNIFKKFWGIAKGLFKLWWTGVKAAWNGLKNAGQWLWNNMLKPVWNKVKSLWNNYVKPGFKLWWSGVKIAWNALKNAGKWVWDNMLKPVFDKVKGLWTNYVKPEIGKWWGRIKNVWATLKGLGKWVKDNVMDPVFTRIKNGWERVRDWLSGAKDMLTSPVKGIVNAVIGGVNGLIKGLNKISDFLPGINFEITPIAKLAAGGPIPERRVGNGFKTNGARAIVGEGKANHPEFVIPTDPTHRRRARALLGMAANRIGAPTDGSVGNSPQRNHGIPAYAFGGWIGDLGKKAWNGVKKLGKNIVSTTYKPIDMLARAAINKVDWQPPKSLAAYGADKMQSWVTQSNKDFENARAKAKAKYDVPVGGNVSVGAVSNPSGRGTYKGGTFSNKFIAHLKMAEKLAGVGMLVMQGGFRPTTSYSGTSHAGDAVDLQASRALITGLRRVGIAAGDRTGLGNWAAHAHAVPGPGAGYAGGSAVWQWQDYMARGGMNQPYNSSWGLAKGGVVKARRGGTLVTAGEAGRDEAVVPLPRNWKSGDAIGGRKVEMNFYGDLSFPNIKSGGDAEELVKNLELLAKD